MFGSPFTLDPFQIDWWAHKADFEEEMEQYMSNMQEGVDIVVTHSPPHGVGDLNMDKIHCGSKAVRKCVEKQNPAVHVFGHIHKGRGAYKTKQVREPFKKKTGNCLVFYPTGGGSTPRPNYFPFFLTKIFYCFKMIYML